MKTLALLLALLMAVLAPVGGALASDSVLPDAPAIILAQAEAPAPTDAAATTPATEPASVKDRVKSSAAKAEDWLETSVRYAIAWLPSVLGALIVLVISLVLSGWIRGTILKGLTRARLDPTLARFFANLTRWAVLLLGFMAAAGTFGINITGFAAILGAIGLAISLGFQGTLSNLASGVLLLIFRPFKVGDSIVAAGQAGVVDAIDLFTTAIDTPDNRRIIVPNSAIFGGTIENVTFHARRRIDVKVPVAGDADPEIVRRVLREAVASVASVPGSIEDPGPGVALVEIAPPTWNVSVWAAAPQMGGVREALLMAIKRGVDIAGVGPRPAAPVVIVRE